jgi:hypothetical protein
VLIYLYAQPEPMFGFLNNVFIRPKFYRQKRLSTFPLPRQIATLSAGEDPPLLADGIESDGLYGLEYRSCVQRETYGDFSALGRFV